MVLLEIKIDSLGGNLLHEGMLKKKSRKRPILWQVVHLNTVFFLVLSKLNS